MSYTHYQWVILYAEHRMLCSLWLTMLVKMFTKFVSLIFEQSFAYVPWRFFSSWHWLPSCPLTHIAEPWSQNKEATKETMTDIHFTVPNIHHLWYSIFFCLSWKMSLLKRRLTPAGIVKALFGKVHICKLLCELQTFKIINVQKILSVC